MISSISRTRRSNGFGCKPTPFGKGGPIVGFGKDLDGYVIELLQLRVKTPA